MIEFKNVSKNFGQVEALTDISFAVGKGEIVGLLGPNAAGKTTTMRLLMGLIKPTKGKILVNSQELNEENLLEIRRNIGYLPETNPLYLEFKVFEYLHFIANVRGIEDFSRLFKKTITDCGLQDVLSKKIEHLSKGYRQRVGLAASLLADPQILVLDEPTIGLDPNQIVEIRKLIKNLSNQKTVIFSSHILSEVQAVCQKVIIIHRGRIVASSDLKKLTRGKSLEKIFQKLTLS